MRSSNNFFSFFLKIILPTLLAIVLYIFLIFSFLIPEYEEAILSRKREMIKELTNSANSILRKYHQEAKDSIYTISEAQKQAVERIKNLRYGEENKDYFWITDMHPTMITHPYRSDLDSTDLTEFADPSGKKMFVEFIQAVELSGEGYVDYMWQWKDDSTRVVPKLSYIKHFKPWNWVIGTGIYVEDVKEEIANMESRLINISLGIVGIISVLLLIITLQSLRLEKRRSRAESNLKKSHEKYKTVVEDLNDGILMLLNGHIIYSNKIIQDLLGFNEKELNNKYILDLLTEEDKTNPEGIRFFKELEKTNQLHLNYEVVFIKKDRKTIIVDMNISKTKILNQNGHIIKVRSLTSQRQKFNEEIDKFKSLTDNINIGVFRAQMEKHGKFLEANFAVINILGFDSKEDFYKTEIFSLFHDKNDRNEFIKTLLKDGNVKNQVIKLNRSDGKIISIAVSAALINDEQGNPKFCDGIIEDISEQMRKEEKREMLITELQTSLLYYNQPITNFIKPLITCDLNTSIKDAAKLMTRKNTEAILVDDEKNNQLGIITDYDLKDRVIAKEIDTNMAVYHIMSSPIIHISDRSLMFEALTEMHDKNISNLAIRNIQGQIISIINYKELSNAQQYSSAYHLRMLKNSKDIEEIKILQGRVPQIIKALLETGGDSANITRFITKISDIITEKLIEFAYKEIGEPPVPFAFLVLGSQGREELTLATDQDNAIIYQDLNDNSDKENIQSYFLKLGEIICDNLNEVGYKHCLGNMMAKNQKWNQPVSIWKKYFAGWMTHFEPNDILEVNTFYDLRYLHGDEQLVNKIKDFISSNIQQKDTFLYNLASYALKFKPQVNLFGSIVTTTMKDEEFFDIKESLIPLTIFARYYALRNKVMDTNTPDRLKTLNEKNIIKSEEYNKFLQAYDYLMLLRLKNHSKQLEIGKDPNNQINPKKLTDIERSMLKKIFSEISQFQDKLKLDFRGMLQ
jgi:PAS domain S-box-containing protein